MWGFTNTPWNQDTVGMSRLVTKGSEGIMEIQIPRFLTSGKWVITKLANLLNYSC